MLEKFGVEMIGANAEVIAKAEERDQFKAGHGADRAGRAAAARRCATWTRPAAWCREIGLPCVVRPSFTLGGTGSASPTTARSSTTWSPTAWTLSPVHQVLLEESVLGWKEYEMEVMRDADDNVVIICSIENFDPMGVHTGDSITVAPAQTLTDKEYQRMRDASIAVIREIGVETGGSNIQFAIDPKTGRMVVIEMNPARQPLQRPGLEGHRLSHRQDRRQAGRRLPAARAAQRHHPRDDGLLRAHDRLRGDQDPAVRLREIPRGRRRC